MINSYIIPQITPIMIGSIVCDICGKTYDNDMDIQEFHHIDFTGGYGSVFGDMTRIMCDICQDCLKKMIGPYCYFDSEDGPVKFMETGATKH